MRFIFFLVLLLAGSCKESPLTIDIPYPGDKLVLWGQLKAGAPISIQVTRTFNPVGAVPEDLTLSNATVSVVVNGEKTIVLSPLSHEKGVYVSDSLVQPGASYVVTASAPSFPDAQSEPVTIPDHLPDVKTERRRDVPGEINHQTPQDLVSIYFADQDKTEDRYYALTFLALFENDTLSGSPYGAMDNVPAKESDCHTWGLEKKVATVYDEYLGKMRDRFATAFLMKSKCLPASDIPVKFYIETSKGDPQHTLEWASNVVLRIEVVTKEAFDYSKAQYDQPEGLDHLVLPPQRALTNIKNGYGLIFASNERILEIP